MYISFSTESVAIKPVFLVPTTFVLVEINENTFFKYALLTGNLLNSFIHKLGVIHANQTSVCLDPHMG